MTQSSSQTESQGLPGRADWVIMGMRWLMGLGFLALNILSSLAAPDKKNVINYLLLAYLVITFVEALLLWLHWGMRAWAQITLALDIVCVFVLLFLSGGIASPLLPFLLLPVGAVSIRLGFSAGLGLNLAAVSGYALLAVLGAAEQDQPGAGLKVGLFGGAIVVLGVFGGLIAEHLGQGAKEEAKRVQQEIERLSAQYAGAHERARAFYEMSLTLSVTMSYSKVLEGILQQCSRLLNFSVGVVLLSAGEEELSVAASSGIRVTDMIRDIHLVGGALFQTLATAEGAILENLGRDEELRQILALQRCRSGMCVPLRAGLRNYGVIVVGSIQENAYSQSDLRQLYGLARFATTAIQNAQLYQDLREERDKIISAEENVRKELSRDLHDGPAQSLAAIAMNVEYIKRLLEEDPDQAIEELDALEQLARKTSWDIRTMLFELRPIILETKGLVPTLEQYVQRFPETDIPRVHLDTGGFEHRLDPKAETTVFTIMQEAVNNARKHAKAKNIWLRLLQQGDQLVASVQDDGVGFDLQAVEASYDQRGSFGLLNMQERATLVGGHTEIRSAKGKGTAIIISVPLKRE